MSCEDRALELNALIDGELPRDAEAGLLAHIASCPACASNLAGLLTLRTRLARLAPAEPPSEALAGRIDQAIAPVQTQPRRPARSLIVAGSGALAIAATLMLLLLPRHHEAPTIHAVADAALRQAIPQAALILADTRRGGAGAWFARHHLATPPVPDLASKGFQFLGCRTDIVAGHRASILVYQRNLHRITLVAWPAHGEPAHGVRSASSGRQAVKYWNDGRLEFWVSGAGAPEIDRFTAAYRTGT